MISLLPPEEGKGNNDLGLVWDVTLNQDVPRHLLAY
jgi:hypothetical protein